MRTHLIAMLEIIAKISYPGPPEGIIITAIR